MLSLSPHDGDNYLKSSKTRYRLDRGGVRYRKGIPTTIHITAMIPLQNDRGTSYKYSRTEIRSAYFV